MSDGRSESGNSRHYLAHPTHKTVANGASQGRSDSVHMLCPVASESLQLYCTVRAPGSPGRRAPRQGSADHNTLKHGPPVVGRARRKTLIHAEPMSSSTRYPGDLKNEKKKKRCRSNRFWKKMVGRRSCVGTSPTIVNGFADPDSHVSV